MSEYILYQDKTFVPEVLIPPALPDPISCPDGFIVGPEHNGRIARIEHDPYNNPRTRDIDYLRQTNEIEVFRQLRADGLKVDPSSKVTFKLGNDLRWVDEFKRLNGVWLADKLFQPAIGWFDTGFPVFTMLGCGGNLVEVLPNGYEFQGWAAINCQSFQEGPHFRDYFKFPHLVTKQVLVAGYDIRRILGNDNYGNCYIPTVAPHRIYLPTWQNEYHNGIRLFEPLPHNTFYNGISVTVTRMCFYGSDTAIEIDGKWYWGEQMEVTDYGDEDDRRVHCAMFAHMPVPPPMYSHTRQE